MTTRAEITETFDCTSTAFEAKFGGLPTGAAWVVFDDEGNSLTGHVVPADDHRQALAFAGVRLAAEAVAP